MPESNGTVPEDCDVQRIQHSLSRGQNQECLRDGYRRVAVAVANRRGRARGRRRSHVHSLTTIPAHALRFKRRPWSRLAPDGFVVGLSPEAAAAGGPGCAVSLRALPSRAWDRRSPYL
ncbi:hypothetical protein ZWY2020_007940 [Hordeum vulgare]|nr:hypothetical protein ZWY2020_007940 [Hordeum vulgare]